MLESEREPSKVVQAPRASRSVCCAITSVLPVPHEADGAGENDVVEGENDSSDKDGDAVMAEEGSVIASGGTV